MSELAKQLGLSEIEILALENDLLSIDTWLEGAMGGQDNSPLVAIIRAKANACKARMAKEAMDVLKADPEVTTMPATEDGLIMALAARGDYRNRRAREVAVVRPAIAAPAVQPVSPSAEWIASQVAEGETTQQAVRRILPEVRIRHDEITQLMHLGRATDEQKREHTGLAELLIELARLGDAQ
jgi:hypothetical protein